MTWTFRNDLKNLRKNNENNEKTATIPNDGLQENDHSHVRKFTNNSNNTTLQFQIYLSERKVLFLQRSYELLLILDKLPDSKKQLKVLKSFNSFNISWLINFKGN